MYSTCTCSHVFVHVHVARYFCGPNLFQIPSKFICVDFIIPWPAIKERVEPLRFLFPKF